MSDKEGYDRNGMCYECGAKAGEHQNCSYGSKLIEVYVAIDLEREQRIEKNFRNAEKK